MDDINKRNHELFLFAYEMRMQDIYEGPPDFFTNYFFYYIKNEIDPLILEIILSNKNEEGRLVVQDNFNFRLMTGPEFKHILKYNEEKSDNVHNRPFVIKDPSLTTADQINTERKK